MRITLILSVVLSLVIAFSACNKDDDSNDGNNNNNNNNTQTNEQRLTSKSWTSYRVKNSGTDVTSSVSPITFNFQTGGTFTATGFSGGGSGAWSLSGTTLDLGSSGVWNITNLTSSDLKLNYQNGVVEIYLQ